MSGPYLVRDAFSSSGTLRVYLWSDYLPGPMMRDFTKKTGIRVVQTAYGENNELLNRVTATKGQGFDLIGPSVHTAPLWRERELLQPFDLNQVAVDALDPAMLRRSTELWTWNGEVYNLPYLWGTEGLAWRTDKWSSEYGKLSYGDLWQPELQGLVMGRPATMMIGIGLYLDAKGDLASNRMLDTYKNEDSMRAIWDEITSFAVKHKTWIKLFWSDAEQQANGFLQNGVVLGQTWGGPALQLRRSGEPISYMAPKEGALAWLDGLAIPSGAQNLPQVYEFLRFMYQAKQAGRLGSNTGYNPVVKGAQRYLSEFARTAFREAYPEDALNKLWWRPPEPPWYAKMMNQFVARFEAA